jgi:sugar lactone lactonase YvrE
MTNKRRISNFCRSISNVKILLLISLILPVSCSRLEKPAPIAFSKVRTILNDAEKFGEPFGIAVREDEIFFSDGETGKIWRLSNNRDFAVVTDKLHTPSAIAFDKTGDLIVADSGTHTIKKVKIETGEIELIAGIENQKGRY